MTTLSQAVQEAIQKDLPGLAAHELATFIKNAEADALALVKAKEQLATANTRIAELKEKMDEHLDLDVRRAHLEKVAVDQQAVELALLKREAQLDAQIARAELAGVKDTVGSFLRNVTVRQTVVEDVAKPVVGSPAGGNGYNGSPGYLVRDSRPDTTTTSEFKE